MGAMGVCGTSPNDDCRGLRPNAMLRRELLMSSDTAGVAGSRCGGGLFRCGRPAIDGLDADDVPGIMDSRFLCAEAFIGIV
jgi:hypothetical protein